MIQANEDYFRVHAWLVYHFGKANKCENYSCTSVNPKRFEWAQIKGMPMIKDRLNFIMMCPSCHRKYDYTDAQKKKLSKSRKEKHLKGTLYNKEYRESLSIAMRNVGNVGVIKLSKETNIVIDEYESVSIAAKKNNILQTSISNVLTNRTKTAGGFKWAYKQTN